MPVTNGTQVTWCFTPSQPLRLYQGETTNGTRSQLERFCNEGNSVLETGPTGLVETEIKTIEDFVLEFA